jgi:hypothetical protein
MSLPASLRRPIVILGVVLSLLVGAATIRAAALWTASSASLVAKPPSVDSLEADLATEQARSAGLQTQLEQLTAGSGAMASALEAARDRIKADATHAQDLVANLEATKAKMVALEQSIAAAKAAVARAMAAPPVVVRVYTKAPAPPKAPLKASKAEPTATPTAAPTAALTAAPAPEPVAVTYVQPAAPPAVQPPAPTPRYGGDDEHEGGGGGGGDD